MGGIAGEEDPAALEGARGVRHRAPSLHVLDLHRHVGVAERRVHEVGAPLHGHVLADAVVPRAVRLGRREHREEPRVAGEREAEEPGQLRVVDVDDAEVAAGEQVVDVALEVDREAVGKAAVPGHRDPELPPHAAVRAVRGDEVVGDDDLFLTALAPAEHRPHVVSALVERDEVGAEQVLGTELGRAPPQDGLKPDLGDEQARRGAQVLDSLVVRAVEVLELLAAEALDRHDRAALLELARRGPFDLLLETDGAQDLHRPLVERGRARMDRRADVALHHEVRHSVLCEEHGGRQADEAAADDEDGEMAFGHGRLLRGRSPAAS